MKGSQWVSKGVGGGWASRVGRQEFWVPSQVLLQIHRVTWPQFPQLPKNGLDVLESLQEGDQRERKVRTRKPLDLESHRPGLHCTVCPWPSQLSSFCPTWCFCIMGLTGLQGRGHEMPSTPDTLPLQDQFPICKEG